MKSVKKFLISNPDIGSMLHERSVKVMDSNGQTLPAAGATMTVDSVALATGDRVLFTKLTDVTKNNLIYEVHNDHGTLNLVPTIPTGSTSVEPHPGTSLLVEQGTHAGELRCFDGSWQLLDLDVLDGPTASFQAESTARMADQTAQRTMLRKDTITWSAGDVTNQFKDLRYPAAQGSMQAALSGLIRTEDTDYITNAEVRPVTLVCPAGSLALQNTVIHITRNGANVGLIFREFIWFNVDGLGDPEVAYASASANNYGLALIQIPVNITSSMTATQVAQAIATAVNLRPQRYQAATPSSSTVVINAYEYAGYETFAWDLGNAPGFTMTFGANDILGNPTASKSNVGARLTIKPGSPLATMVMTGNTNSNTTLSGLNIIGIGNGISVGMFVSGTGIPANTTVTAIQTLAPQNGTLTTGSDTITGLTSTAGVSLGGAITGTGIPAASVVTRILPGGTSVRFSGLATTTGVSANVVLTTNNVTISQAATATATGVTLTFSGAQAVVANEAMVLQYNPNSYLHVTKTKSNLKWGGPKSADVGKAVAYSTSTSTFPSVQYTDVGAGIPVVFVADPQQSVRLLAYYMIKELPDKCRCIGLQLPYAAGTTFPVGDTTAPDWNPDSWVRLTIDFIQSLGLGPVVLHGAFLGARVAIEVATYRPDLVSKLIVENPTISNPHGGSMVQAWAASVGGSQPTTTQTHLDDWSLMNDEVKYIHDGGTIGGWNALPQLQRDQLGRTFMKQWMGPIAGSPTRTFNDGVTTRSYTSNFIVPLNAFGENIIEANTLGFYFRSFYTDVGGYPEPTFAQLASIKVPTLILSGTSSAALVLDECNAVLAGINAGTPGLAQAKLNFAGAPFIPSGDANNFNDTMLAFLKK